MTRTGVCYHKLDPRVADELRRRVDKIKQNDFIKDLIALFSDEKNFSERSQLSSEPEPPRVRPAGPNGLQQHMRIEENLSQQSNNRPAFGSYSQTHSYQSFGRPVPPQSEALKRRQTGGGFNEESDSRRLSNTISERERGNRSDIERLKREAAEVYEKLRRQV